ncbi:MAG: hypothetical protein V1790_04920 [Planctomycetota bacterium]
MGEAQVRAVQSVERQPAPAVAGYSILLLAAARAYGTDTPTGRLPLPKWQSKRPHERLSTQELVRQLRSEVWAHAINTLQPDSDDFVYGTGSLTKSSELRLPAVSAMLYSATG